jgi:hypothetical protein
MTGIDLILAAPWIIFAIGLATICILLMRSRRAARRPASRPSRPDRVSPGQELARDPHPQEERCPQKNAEARRP